MRLSPLAVSLVFALFGLTRQSLAAEFRFDGELSDGGNPAAGLYDLELNVYDAEQGGLRKSLPIQFAQVSVQNGRFSLPLELPETATDVWVSVDVRASGESTFSAIPGRSKAILAGPIGTCWSTTGDSGSDPETHFLGTTDAKPLVLRTNNAASLRLEPSSVTLTGLPITSNTVAGSYANSASTAVRGATIAGGGLPFGNSDPLYTAEAPNIVSDHFGTIGGGYGNIAGGSNESSDDEPFSTVGGGRGNVAGGRSSTVGGGETNSATDTGATVAGGGANIASGFHATVGGGALNTASGPNATVSGGDENVGSGSAAAISGGSQGVAAGEYSAIIGGLFNETRGSYSTASGGYANCAGGSQSWVGGTYARTRPGPGGTLDFACSNAPRTTTDGGDIGTFVWADGQNDYLTSTGSDQFLIRARGGVAINTPSPGPDVELTLQSGANGNDYANLWLKQRSTSRGVLISSGDGSTLSHSGFYIDQYNGLSQLRRLSLSPDGSVFIRSNFVEPMTGVSMAANGGSWTSLSDRRVKTAIAAVDPSQILKRLTELPISTWSYIAQGSDIRHIGPMAQDFMAAFQVGESDTGITTIDADGVAMAAIQGLNQKLEAENALLSEKATALAADNAEIRAELAELRALIKARLEQ